MIDFGASAGPEAVEPYYARRVSDIDMGAGEGAAGVGIDLKLDPER